MFSTATLEAAKTALLAADYQIKVWQGGNVTRLYVSENGKGRGYVEAVEGGVKVEGHKVDYLYKVVCRGEVAAVVTAPVVAAPVAPAVETVAVVAPVAAPVATAPKTVTVARAARHDAIYNEGGEGYNPSRTTAREAMLRDEAPLSDDGE